MASQLLYIKAKKQTVEYYKDNSFITIWIKFPSFLDNRIY